MLTSHPQFARATVNLFWAELMGQGIVDGPFEFDLARQDPRTRHPRPGPSNPRIRNCLKNSPRISGRTATTCAA